jgi:hypothetical protein
MNSESCGLDQTLIALEGEIAALQGDASVAPLAYLTGADVSSMYEGMTVIAVRAPTGGVIYVPEQDVEGGGPATHSLCFRSADGPMAFHLLGKSGRVEVLHATEGYAGGGEWEGAEEEGGGGSYNEGSGSGAGAGAPGRAVGGRKRKGRSLQPSSGRRGRVDDGGGGREVEAGAAEAMLLGMGGGGGLEEAEEGAGAGSYAPSMGFERG